MKKIWICLILIFGCTGRPPYVVKPYSPPEVIVRNIEKEVGTNLDNLESLGIENEEENMMFFPDPTKGYIENKAYPFVPKVWIITKGEKVLLVGPEEEPPEFLDGEIREFRFSPGLYVLCIERWRLMPGGWKKIGRDKVVKLSVAQSEQQLSAVNHYGWWIVIHQNSIEIH